jgi:DNA-binding LacI/PurR family transcriptional regulator
MGQTYVNPDSLLARTARETLAAHAGGAGPGDGMTACPVCGEPLPCSSGRAAAEVLFAAGLAESSGELVEAGDFTEEGGATAMARLLARPGDPVDAVFAASDLMAAGALRALRAAGRRVPEDVAVVGFEDSAVARYAQPPLTTVRQPIEEMGRQATRLLLGQIAGEAGGMHLILDTELVVRSST